MAQARGTGHYGALIRGGNFNNGTNAGVFAVDGNNTPSNANNMDDFIVRAPDVVAEAEVTERGAPLTFAHGDARELLDAVAPCPAGGSFSSVAIASAQRAGNS